MTTDPPSPDTAPAPLHAESIGEGPRLVMAHGFTQTGRVWGLLDRRLAADHRVVKVDMPGHAGSTGVVADLTGGARLLAEAGEAATYLGYSMGARFCMHLALARPDLVDRLVLISGTAGIDDPTERAARCRADEALAAELDPLDGRAGMSVAAFLRRWLDGPLFAGISPEATGFDERLRNTGSGLASSLRLAGTGTQDPLWARLGELTMPVLVITGERDGKFTALGRRLAEAVGANATHSVVAGTGHSPQLQRPDAVAAMIRNHPARPEPR
jgi:2-succinyl-6-hydroxy-2,4-cyclohexadiene-1-carboxylate synthase